VVLVAVCDIDRERAEAFAAEFGIAHVCDDLDQMISRGLVDLVDIVTPPLTHRKLVADALASHTVHVICEKPLALNPVEAEAMVGLSEAARVGTFTAFQRRYDPSLVYLRRMIADGYLGDLVLANIGVIVNWGVLKRRSQARGYRQWLDSTASGGGFIGGALPHYIDLVCHLLGEITHLVSHSGTAPTFAAAESDGEGADDTVVVAGTLRCGGMFNLAATWAAAQPTLERWEIVGTKRTVQVHPDGRLFVTTGSGSLEELPLPPGVEPPRPGSINRGFGFGNAAPGFAALVSDVARSLRCGDVPLCATFEDGLRSALIIDRLSKRERSEARL
jgi:predicted dehydrogenase